MKTRRVVQASLDEVAYQIIRKAILSPKGVEAGDRLDERELADGLGISRTPIREAIRRLEAEGLVRRAPRRGAFVADLSPDAIDELFSIREVLEGLAARLAAERGTDKEFAALRATYRRYASGVETHSFEVILDQDTEFHDLIARASRNERLQTTIRMFRDQLRLLRTRSVRIAGRSEKSLAEMGQVLDAIIGRSAEEAERAMRLHIGRARQDVLSAHEPDSD